MVGVETGLLSRNDVYRQALNAKTINGKSIVDIIGVTRQTKPTREGYAQVLQFLNVENDLGLSEEYIKTKALILEAASGMFRFSDQDNIAPSYKGDIAEHPIFAAMKAHVLFRDQLDGAGDPSFNDVIRNTLCGLLTHDDGELCGEFGSVISEAKGQGKDIDLEPSIAENSYVLAAYAVQNGDEQAFLDFIKERQTLFTDHQRAYRGADEQWRENGQVGERPVNNLQNTLLESEQLFKDKIADYKTTFGELDSSFADATRQMYRHYSIAEEIEPDFSQLSSDSVLRDEGVRGFIHLLCRTIERSEGNAHFVWFDGKQAPLTMKTGEELSVTSSFNYGEKYIGHLFAALDELPQELQADALNVAKGVRDSCYEMMALMAIRGGDVYYNIVYHDPSVDHTPISNKLLATAYLDAIKKDRIPQKGELISEQVALTNGAIASEVTNLSGLASQLRALENYDVAHIQAA